jgi:hypothetical protein
MLQYGIAECRLNGSHTFKHCGVISLRALSGLNLTNINCCERGSKGNKSIKKHKGGRYLRGNTDELLLELIFGSGVNLRSGPNDKRQLKAQNINL